MSGSRDFQLQLRAHAIHGTALSGQPTVQTVERHHRTQSNYRFDRESIQTATCQSTPVLCKLNPTAATTVGFVLLTLSGLETVLASESSIAQNKVIS